jgi:hypothetical protein
VSEDDTVRHAVSYISSINEYDVLRHRNEVLMIFHKFFALHAIVHYDVGDFRTPMWTECSPILDSFVNSQSPRAVGTTVRKEVEVKTGEKELFARSSW